MKRNRIIKIVIAIVAAVIALWFSFYTEPLSEKLKREQAGLFDADACVKEQWNNLVQLKTDAIRYLLKMTRRLWLKRLGRNGRFP